MTELHTAVGVISVGMAALAALVAYHLGEARSALPRLMREWLELPGGGGPSQEEPGQSHWTLRKKLEQAAVRRKDVADIEAGPVLFKLFDFASHAARRRHGRQPERAEVFAEIQLYPALNGLGADGFDWLMKCRLRALAREADESRIAKNSRTAQRRMNLALRFLPKGERERYREEWEAEIQDLPPAAAARFACVVLVMAPKSGLILWVRKLFGRLA
ncbi:hypothetical protein [Streptomyces sp. M54]|uniref:hypothetical protein n=1 Tax=Streptomyces sp. M54 TaxID=2759525 RepID=UPI001A8F257C|nr:hypothetical protein [Streptomyces sp. M54]QSS95430.1 hypothetical protein H3V39_33750 [Streptomyces sp. M54]